MTTVVPPPPPTLPGSLPTPAPLVTAVNPPPPLAQLPVGTLIEAMLTGAGEKGLIQVRTKFGNLNLLTNITLPTAATIELQIEKLTPQLLFLLKAINGKALGRSAREGQFVQSHLQQTAAPKGASGAQSALKSGHPTGARAVTGAPGPQVAVSLDIGTTVKAIFLRASAPSGAGQLAIQRAQAWTGEVGSTSPPGQAKASEAPAAQSGKEASGGQIRPRATTKTPVPGTLANLRILSFAAESQAPTILQTASQQPGTNAISGRVVGSTPSGFSLVQTPIGLLALETAKPLPTGSTMSFEISGKMEPPKLHGGLNAAQEIFLSREWPQLEEAITQLRQRAPEALQQLLNNTIPRGNSQMTANILFFLTALKGGNIRFWLGGGVSGALERDRPDLLARLGEDFSQLSRTFNDPSASGWRTAMVPFFFGEYLEQVRMHTKAHDQEEEEQDDSSRFIIDVEMSHLGRIQLDGLIAGKAKRFDLIFRSTKPMPAHMRKDINKIFMDSTEATGVDGTIVFQAHTKFVEIPLILEVKHSESGLIV